MINKKFPRRLLCLLTICLVSTASNAKDRADTELIHAERARQFLQALQWETTAEQELQRAISGMRRSGLQDEFIAEFEEHASASDLTELLVPFIMEQFSPEELLGFVDFFNTSGGSKVSISLVSISLRSHPMGDSFDELLNSLNEGEAEPVATFFSSPLWDGYVANYKPMLDAFRGISKKYVFDLAKEIDPRVQGETRRSGLERPNKAFELTSLLSRPWHQGSGTIGSRAQSHGRASVCSSTPIRYVYWEEL